MSTAFSLIKEILTMFWLTITTLIPAELKMFFDIKNAVDSTASYFKAFDIIICAFASISAILFAIRLKFRKTLK